MEVVIDASAVIAVLVNESEKAALLELTLGTQLIAPASVHWEIGNAFSAMLKRRRIKLPEAVTAIETYLTIPIRMVDVQLVEALRLAERLNLYAYDAYLLACAVRYRVPLLSLDRDLVAAARSLGLDTLEVPP